jgi:hypothetical protein
VRQIRTLIDPGKGLATQTLSVAISGIDGQGIDPPIPYLPVPPAVNDPLTVVTPIVLQTFVGGSLSAEPEPAESGYFVNQKYETISTWRGNESDLNTPIEYYRRGFKIITPPIHGGDVDDLEQQIQETVLVSVPVDPYSVNFSGAC